MFLRDFPSLGSKLVVIINFPTKGFLSNRRILFQLVKNPMFLW